MSTKCIAIWNTDQPQNDINHKSKIGMQFTSTQQPHPVFSNLYLFTKSINGRREGPSLPNPSLDTSRGENKIKDDN